MAEVYRIVERAVGASSRRCSPDMAKLPYRAVGTTGGAEPPPAVRRRRPCRDEPLEPLRPRVSRPGCDVCGAQGSFVHRAAIFFASSPGTHITMTFAPAAPVLCRILSGGRT